MKIKKIIKRWKQKIKAGIVYYIFLNKAKQAGVPKVQAQIIAKEYVYFKYLYDLDNTL